MQGTGLSGTRWAPPERSRFALFGTVKIILRCSLRLQPSATAAPVPTYYCA